jgi:hypothetical protein
MAHPKNVRAFGSKPKLNLPDMNAMPAKMYTNEKTEPDKR